MPASIPPIFKKLISLVFILVAAALAIAERPIRVADILNHTSGAQNIRLRSGSDRVSQGRM